jgi:hypothetical protein
MAVSLMFVSRVVDGVWVFQHRIDGFPLGVFIDAVEAAFTPGVAGDAAQLLDHQDDHVGVAVQAQFVEFLHVAGFFALAPQLTART